MSIAIFLQYSAYFPISNLLSTIDKTLGNYALTAISGAFCVFSLFFSPPLASALGYRISLTIASLTFFCFVMGTFLASNFGAAVLIPGACIVGCGIQKRKFEIQGEKKKEKKIIVVFKIK